MTKHRKTRIKSARKREITFNFLADFIMKPKSSSHTNFQLSLTKIPLHSLVSKEHPLVKLASISNWKSLKESFGRFFEETGRPAIPTRLMIALHYLKYLNDLSDKEVVAMWVENPYWQFFSGGQFFEYELPIDSSSMTRWRQRIKKPGAEEFLLETIRLGLMTKVVKPSEIKNVNIDTTVQEKNIRFPTDARLYQRALTKLARLAKKEGIELRQTYSRVSKKILKKQQTRKNSRKFADSKKCTKKLRTLLGRVIRDVERKMQNPTEKLLNLLEIYKKIHAQEKNSKNKIYSVHEPDTSCIAKEKVHVKYEFGSKVSIVSTNKSNFILAAINFQGNPTDCKTFAPALEQLSNFDLDVKNVFVDKGYKGHEIKDKTVHICTSDKKKKGRTLWTQVKRRAAVEPVIGHLKSDSCLGKNKLSGIEGDSFNVIFSCIAFNLRKMLKRLKSLVLYFFYACFITLLPAQCQKAHKVAA